MHLRPSHFIVLMLMLAGHAFAGSFSGDGARNENACHLTVGIQETLDPVFFVETMGPTLAHLRKALRGCTIRSRLLASSEFDNAVARKDIDLFMSDSGVFAYGEKRWGARQLAVRQSPKTTDPSRAVSAAIIVRSDRKEFQSLPSLEAQSSQTRATRGFASVVAFHLIG